MPDLPANNNELLENVSLPFMIESSGIRGRFVRLNSQINSILTGHKYPKRASQLLGELVTLATMLGSMLKIDGILSIQASGDGAISLMTADYTGQSNIRGYAKINDKKAIESLPTKKRDQQDIKTIFGSGHIMITIENPNEKPYQAIVALEGKSLAECLINYFKQSDQLKASIEISTDKVDGKWVSSGILIQNMPSEGGKNVDIAPKRTQEEREDLWNTAKMLLASVTDEELLSKEITPHELLYRLFHEEGIRVFDPLSIEAKCRCSRQRMLSALINLPKDDISSLKKDGKITMQCHFCNREEIFDDNDL
ncbi:Hsp33 family molecular chaperone HslO [Rickettsiales bacterium]|nr:Hsp33 family molecular chaperone HslO [Rickettsiales bacterium]